MEMHHMLHLYIYKSTHEANDNKKMANQKRAKDARSQSKPNMQCKKHPKHRQSPGVCSLCLREKLSQLPTSSSRGTGTAMGSSSSTSSVSSYSSSSGASSYSSPLHRYRFTTTTTEGKGSLSLLFSGKSLLTKSRSLAFVPRMRSKEVDDVKKKKDWFWSRLIHPRKKRIDEGLVHSRTVRERVIQAS